MYLLGFDIGSSSVKVALAEISSGKKIGLAQYPLVEMDIKAPQAGWAEQAPEDWWAYACKATKMLLEETEISADNIKAIGIAYQMHGLVSLDGLGDTIRPAIIWCDSRAVETGQSAFDDLGHSFCLEHYLNSPGNFTASKLRWVKENEPELFAKIDKIMLPGDYIAYRMSGDIKTTITGLSEGIFWDFKNNSLATDLLTHYGLSSDQIPEITENFSIQAELSKEAAEEMGLLAGIPITYRAGDQPNNAMALNVLNPGEIAATGGTSGVVYAVVDEPLYDLKSRVNGFAHVNHELENTRIGILLCINGAGSQYGWVRKHIATSGLSYFDMEAEAKNISIGSDGLVVMPFGNGAERMLENKNLHAHFHKLDLNRHGQRHIYRATLEGIAFAFVYGIDILKDLGIEVNIIRVGNDNLFLSDIFSQTISNLTGATIEMIDSTGALGAALAAGVGVGAFDSIEEAQEKNEVVKSIKPESNISSYQHAYISWKKELDKLVLA